MGQTIEQLRDKVAEAGTELVRAEERLKQEKDNLKAVLEEMKEAGVTPKDIDAKIAKLEADLQAETERITEQVADIEEALTEDGPRTLDSKSEMTDDSDIAKTIDSLNFDD